MHANESPIQTIIRTPFDAMTDDVVAELLGDLRRIRNTQRHADGRHVDDVELSVVNHQCAQLRAVQMRRAAGLA